MPTKPMQIACCKFAHCHACSSAWEFHCDTGLLTSIPPITQELRWQAWGKGCWHRQVSISEIWKRPPAWPSLRYRLWKWVPCETRSSSRPTFVGQLAGAHRWFLLHVCDPQDATGNRLLPALTPLLRRWLPSEARRMGKQLKNQTRWVGFYAKQL